MAPYWLWRAIGGTLMWMSHIVLAYNLYKMIAGRDYSDIRDAAFLQLEQTDTDEKKNNSLENL